MPKLPILSGAELTKLLIKAGFQRVRQKGSHVSLQKGEFKKEIGKLRNWASKKRIDVNKIDLETCMEFWGEYIQ
jgi:hypothetical protein